MTTAYNPRIASQLRGGDPAPGDTGTIWSLIGRLEAASDGISDCVNEVRSIGTDPGMWIGQAADAFADRQQDLLRRLGTAQSCYADASDALRTWVKTLEQDQLSAAHIAVQARALPRNPDGSPAAGLAALQQAHNRLAVQATSAQERCAQGLRDVAHRLGAMDHRSRWDTFVADVVLAHDVLKKVSEALNILALATFWIPGLGEFTAALAGVAMITNLLLVGSDAFLYKEGKVSGKTLLWDTGGLVLSGAGSAAHGILKAGRDAQLFQDAAGSARVMATDASWEAGQAGDIISALNAGSRAKLYSEDATFFQGLGDRVGQEARIGVAGREEFQNLFNPAAAVRDAQADRIVMEPLRDVAGHYPTVHSWLTGSLNHPFASGVRLGDLAKQSWDAIGTLTGKGEKDGD